MVELLPRDLDDQLQAAVKAFWTGRSLAAEQQKERGKVQDQGTRSSVTAGGHLDGLRDVAVNVVKHVGLPSGSIRAGRGNVTLPGYFRAGKKWDVLAVHEGQLLAALELKSMVGSEGNNQNNRSEETLGVAADFAKAHEKGLFAAGPRPWIGWAMVFDPTRSVKAVKPGASNFPLDPIFKDTTYCDRYRILVRRMVEEGVYNAGAVVLTRPEHVKTGAFEEPDPEHTLRKLLASLAGRVAGHLAGT